MPNDLLCLQYISLSNNIHTLLLTIDAYYISNWNSQSWYIKQLVNHWHIVSNNVFTPLFLIVLIALTFTNTSFAFPFDFRVGRINLGLFGVTLTSRYSGHCWISMALCCSLSDSISAAPLSSLSSWVSKSASQVRQYLVSEICSVVHTGSV